LWGIKKAKIRQKMSEQKSNGVLAENPLELEMIFAEGVFLHPEDSKPGISDKNVVMPETEHEVTVETEAANTMNEVANVKLSEPDMEIQPKTEIEETSTVDIPIVKTEEEDLAKAQEIVSVQKIILNKPVRVLIRYSDGLFEDETKTRDLIGKFFSIITKNGKVLDETFFEIVDVKNRDILPIEVLLDKAIKIIVFGKVENEVCDGLKPFELRNFSKVSVAQFPALSEIMESNENKQKFALALKKYFGQ